MVKKIEISHRTIIFTFFLLFLLWFFYQIRQIVFLVYISSILMVALNPFVSSLERFKIPRSLAILICYLAFLAILSLIIGSLLPSLLEQTKRLIDSFSPFLETLDFAQVNQSPLSSQLGSLPEKSLRFFMGLLSNFVAIFALMVITFYLLMERKNLTSYIFILFGDHNTGRAEVVINKIEAQLGGWVRGQTLLCFLVGLMTYLGLRFLGIEFALPLAILAGLLEIVPNIGPALSAVPAVLIALVVSPLSALAVAALYFLVQQIENYLIVPGIMRRAVNLNPLVIIIALMIGFKIGGILGTILAVPTVLVLRVLASEAASSKRFQKT